MKVREFLVGIKEKHFSGGKLSKKKIIIISSICIVLLIGVSAAALISKKDEASKKPSEIMTTSPYISTIELTVSGSGTVEPNDRYEVTSLVSGDIINCELEEGDIVNEDDLLYVIDPSEQEKNIKQVENSITKSRIRNKTYLDEKEYQKTLAKYTVRAESDGILTGFSLKVDDKVNSNGNYGTIQDNQTIIATVPFNAAQCEKISIGDTATVGFFPSMFTAEGKVTYKSYSAVGYENGVVVYDVEITIENTPIALTDSSVSAVINTSSGDVESPASGKISYKDPVKVISEVSGEVKSIPENIKDGAIVKEGDILFEIDSSDFKEEKILAEFDYSDLQINLENAKDRLDDYYISAPINGTIITKNYKKGDKVNSGANSSALMVIADMSAMKFTFSADETDIGKIKVGQEVRVTAEAVNNKVFMGKVTKVATEGVSSNGVSYYEIEVIIDDYGQDTEEYLRSGMNVSAEIVYTRAENVLCVPTSAITTFGGQSYVFVKGEKKDDDGQKSSAAEGFKGEISKEQNGEIPLGNAPFDKEGENPDLSVKDSGSKYGKDSSDRDKSISERIAALVPDGFHAVRVETGATDGLRVEIVEGITENDVIYLNESNNVLAPVSNSNASGFTGMGGKGFPSGMGGMGGMSGRNMGGAPGGMRGF